MTEVLRFKVEKLIRDRLPEMMRAQGLSVFERRLSDDEFVASLERKLLEEAAEAAAAPTDRRLDELADVLEVMLALAALQGASFQDIERRRIAKRAERGGFEARIYNERVEVETGSPAAQYYLDRPEQYPRI